MNDKLKRLLRAQYHTDVVHIMLEEADLKDFDVYHDRLWTLIVPKDIKEYCPLISCHTDTVHKSKPMVFDFRDGIVRNANTKNGLGADDRAGCYILSELLKDNQHYIYAIFDQEEIGGLGSEHFVKSIEFEQIVCEYASCFIGLDRKGSKDCASYDYDNKELFEIMNEYGGYEYTFGSFTDVMNLSHHSLVGDASQLACCNLSIGYEKEHTKQESLNIYHMEATLKFLKEDLPEDCWKKRFIAEETTRFNRYSWNSYFDTSGVDNTFAPVVCDICGSHEKLWNVSWGNLCSACKHEFA